MITPTQVSNSYNCSERTQAPCSLNMMDTNRNGGESLVFMEVSSVKILRGNSKFHVDIWNIFNLLKYNSRNI